MTFEEYIETAECARDIYGHADYRLSDMRAAFSAGQADTFRESPALLDEARRYLAINAIPTGSRQNESQEYVLIRKLVSSLGSAHKTSRALRPSSPARRNVEGKPIPG